MIRAYLVSVGLDSQTLQSLTVRLPQRSSNFNISASDSTKDSTFNLNVDASLKLSFMSGLIQVGGSANYLNDQKESKNQCRVTLQYQATTYFEQLCLTADVCKKIKGSHIAEKDLATHIVTGIEYGANAFFVFDSQKEEASNVQTVKGQMEATIKKIPTVDIQGQAKVDLTEEEKNLVKTFSVKFYGDFLLESNPATFEAAVQTYVNLPKLLIGGDGKEPVNSVPVRVWLLPLQAITLESTPVTKGIRVGLVVEAKIILEELAGIKMRCNDCLSVEAVGKFPELLQQVHMFSKLCHYYTTELQRQMAEKCPAIRAGTKTETVLKSLFDNREKSPFNQGKLTQWLDDKEREVNVVQSCLDIMKGIPVLSTQAEVDKLVLAPGDEMRCGYYFTSLGGTDAQLEQMVQYLDTLKLGETYKDTKTLSKEVPWYNKNDEVTKMRRRAVNYKKHIGKTAQFVTAKNNTQITGSATYVYKQGVLEKMDDRVHGDE